MVSQKDFEYLMQFYISYKDFKKCIPKDEKITEKHWFLESKETLEHVYSVPMWISGKGVSINDDTTLCYHWYILLRALFEYHPTIAFNLVTKFIDITDRPKFVKLFRQVIYPTELNFDIDENVDLSPNTSVKLGTATGNFKKKYVYVIHDIDGDVYKIGHSISVKMRLDQLQTSTPHNLQIYKSYQVDDYINIEKELHLHFMEKNIRGEWFRLDPSDIQFIDEYINNKSGKCVVSNAPHHTIIDIKIFENMITCNGRA